MARTQRTKRKLTKATKNASGLKKAKRAKKQAVAQPIKNDAELKEAKLAEWTSEDKEQFKKDHANSCWNFAETGECTFGEDCRFNHVTRAGEVVQERKVKTKSKSGKTNEKKKTKEELIEEREIDGEEDIYTGTVKYYRTKSGFGFISIDNEITFQDLTVKGKIYVMKDDIISESESIGLKKDTKVIFKVYKDSMGLGAMDVTNEDGSPIAFEEETD